MISRPMYFPAEPFDLKHVLSCCDLVITAYDMYHQWKQQGSSLNSFNWKPNGPSIHYSEPIWGYTSFFSFKFSEPFGFIGWTEQGDVYLVYRGTDSTDDWIDNIELEHRPYDLVEGYGFVHEGFLDLYRSLHQHTLEALQQVPHAQRLFITGHSLGSALSTLAVPDVIAHTNWSANSPVYHYNLASPRVAAPTFAAAYNQNGVPTYRIVNTCDLVPEIPASVLVEFLKTYEHIGIPVNFTAQYGSIDRNHDCRNSYYYALQHPQQPQGAIAI